jgi:hypothetical protein
MALLSTEIERIYTEIVLGLPRSESLVEMRPEVVAFWDTLSAEVERMRADGKSFKMISEFADVMPVSDELRFNPQQPRDPDGKFASGGGMGATGDGGDIPIGVLSSSAGSKVELDEDVEDMAHSDPEMYAGIVDGVLTDEQGDYIASLDGDTHQAIGDYTSSGYNATNKVLRGAPPPPVESQEVAERALRRGEKVDAAIRNAPPLEGGVIVYRGANVKTLGVEKVEDVDGLIGGTFTDSGIISTSLNQEVSGKFAFESGMGKQGVLIEMRVPAGSKALYVEPITEISGENELLLPRGTTFTVVSRTNYNIVVDVNTGD